MSGCDVLYRRFFVRWYRLPAGEKPPRMLRGDLEIYEGAEGTSADHQCRLPEAMKEKLAANVKSIVAAASADWSTYLGVAEPVSFDGLRAFDEHWSRKAIASLIRRSDPSDFANDYLVVTCELGAVLGEVMKALRPELGWIYRSPYWESCLWHSQTASLIPVFHWAINRMSAYGAQDRLCPKLLKGLEQLPSKGQ